MDGALLNLAKASKRVTDLAYAACTHRLSDIGRLHRAMHEYEERARGYLATPLPGDFVREQAERYEGDTREALERVAQLMDRALALADQLPSHVNVDQARI